MDHRKRHNVSFSAALSALRLDMAKWALGASLRASPGLGRWHAIKCGLVLAALLLGSLAESPPRAGASPWAMRSSGAVAGMVSPDQLRKLGYNNVGLLGTLSLSRELVPYLGAQASLRGGSFLSHSRAGGLIGLGLGLVVRGQEASYVPYASLEAGCAFTGELKRPWLSAAIGVDFRLNPKLALGPVLGIDDIVQRDRPGASSDAVFMWLGVALRYWPTSAPPAPKPRAQVVEFEPAPVVPRTPPSDDSELRALIERSIDPAPIRHELLAPVLFGNDSALLEPQGIAMLHEVARTLKANKNIRLVEIRGYADRRGSAAHNRVLSEERARQVEGWLIEHGISPSRLRVVAEGERDPIEVGDGTSEHAQNRRVVFRILETSEP
jgi:outer membrane protein OmpA-like peptidoglycan-associated protein